jgi:hypothetical protein
MAGTLTKRIEQASNIAVIVAAVVVSAVYIQRWFGAMPAAGPGFDRKAVNLASLTSAPAKVNIVLGLSIACRFCEENAPFYRTLASSTQPGGVALFAVFPQPRADAEQYLDRHSIRADGVSSHPLADYGISGTPTLLLLDSGGKVIRAWVGALDSSRQQEVLESIRKSL